MVRAKKDTLILNADGLPLSMVPVSELSWQEAIKLKFLDRADVMASYEDWVVHSASGFTMNVPAVMMLREYVNVARGLKFSRDNIRLRDDYTCQYCQVDFSNEPNKLTLDHVVPRFNGGKTNWENIVAACSDCNLEKAHFSKMKPVRMPTRPSYHQLMAKQMSRHIEVPHASWGEYLGLEPELVTVRTKRRRKSK